MIFVMSTSGLCRDTFGYFNSSAFSLWTCSLCFTYLFPKSKYLRFNWEQDQPRLFSNKSDAVEYFQTNIRSSEDKTKICSHLSEPDCERWQSCCKSAISCCNKQSSYRSSSGKYCPLTWDGFSCVDQAKPGALSTINCPEFIQFGFSSGYARKSCTENGTWWIDQTSQREWTDYTPCLNLKIYKSLVYVGLVSSGISLVLLIPACSVFLSIRQLRSQRRIRLHICLFFSFILKCLTTILWDLLVYNDRLDNPTTTSRMNQNTVFCRILYALNRYCHTCNFFWMFCEGFYLHRLLIQAFRVPKTLFWYYVIGWGGPTFPILLYVTVRLHFADYECWVKNIGVYEWIIYIPNLLCILLNFLFLCSILRIMLTGLQSHANEPNNYRRGLKATFLLVPLFGIQLFLITYRPSAENSHRLLYEIVSKFIIDSQGAVVSLIFFYMNAEIHLSIKHRFHSASLRLPCVQERHNESRNLSLTNISLLRLSVPKKDNYNVINPKSAVKINDEVKEFVFS